MKEGGIIHRLTILRRDFVRLSRRGRFVALARVTWTTLVLRHYSELCEVCGRRYPHWAAPTWLYERVHGSRGGQMCHNCFDRRAESMGVTLLWRPVPFSFEAIEEVWSQESVPAGFDAARGGG